MPPNSAETNITIAHDPPANPTAIQHSGSILGALHYARELSSGPCPGLHIVSNAFQADHRSSQPMPTLAPYLTSSTTIQHPTMTGSVHTRVQRDDSATKKTSRKRPSSSEQSLDHRLSKARRTLSKQAAVPEGSLVLLSFGPTPALKRKRTKAQRENKRAMMNVGGSCFLCLLNKKRVLSLIGLPPLPCNFLLTSGVVLKYRSVRHVQKILAASSLRIHQFHVDLQCQDEAHRPYSLFRS